MEVKITLYGAYGIIIQDSKLLLTEKIAGPYKGLWDLPGGAIEFGEDPKASLHREIQEKTALFAQHLELITVMSNYGHYLNNEVEYQFHHVGIIYRVSGISPIKDLVPEDSIKWVDLNQLKSEELTPFARQAKLIPH